MKSWDPIWEKIYSSQGWGEYPPEELIRFMAKNYYKVKPRSKIKVLDLGCGIGAGSWYLAREGFSVYGIDGSPTAIKLAKRKLNKEGLKGNFKAGDFSDKQYPDGFFDVAIDITSIQHNKASSALKIIDNIYDMLKEKGRFFGMLMTTKCWGYKKGKRIEKNTFVKINEGPLENRGLTHFFTFREIQSFFKKFKNLHIEYSERSYKDRKHVIKLWIVTAEKA